MRSFRVAVVVTLLVVPAVLFAQRPMTLGSIAPPNSLWDKTLKEMAAALQTATNRRVRLRIASSSQGDESTIVRRLKLNSTQAALLSLPALSEIDAAFNVLGMPFFFNSDAEARHVLATLEPTLKQALADQGFVLIGWGHTGWAYFFTANPVKTLDDLRRTKIFTSAGDDAMVQWYKENGFEPVPLAVTDVAMGLNTGLINAYPLPPYAVMLVQYYRSAPYMLDVPLAPVINALVVTAKAWAGLSTDDQEVFRTVGKQIEDQLWEEVPRQDREAIKVMRGRGLTTVVPDEAAKTKLRRNVDELTASMRGSMIPLDIFDLALQTRNAYRGQ